MSSNTTKSVAGFTMSGSQDNQIAIDAGSSLMCQYCHTDIEVQPIVFLRIDETNVKVFLKCKKCQEGFVGSYSRGPDFRTYYLQKIIGGNPKFNIFSVNIKKISPNFVKIYNQSECAEKENLEEISGMGYRKSLEFLIKDFLVKKFSEKEDEITNKFLGNCIKDYFENKRIQEIAERATWLGNDETHYTRIWENKDVEDLKKMIDILVNYIDMELLTDNYLDDMPKTKKS
jgi:hypothetical protein